MKTVASIAQSLAKDAQTGKAPILHRRAMVDSGSLSRSLTWPDCSSVVRRAVHGWDWWMHLKSKKICRLGVAAIAALLALSNNPARADEGGVSFWIPGFFGSLAAVPQQASGWSVTSIYYHTSVSAGADVARAREITIGNLPVSVSASVNANVNANANIGFLAGTYTFATPVLGGQASATLLAGYGANSTSLAGSLLGTITGPAGGVLPFSRFDSIDSNIIAFTDLIPQFALRWNAGVHNYMTYITGDLPVGAYQSNRLANM